MIVLVGFMGAGKSTVGRALADRLCLPFIDADLAIEQAELRSIREIFTVGGEPEFRRIERETIARLLVGPEAVLSLGGGAVEDPDTRRALAAVPVVFLQVDLAEALARTGDDPARPMLRRPDLAELFTHRQAAYQEVATVTVTVGGRSVDEVVTAILGELLALLDPAADPVGD
ncbi:MAG TPA: shikimate kinase [Kineosporiaceae bacterium]|nr:shikimate kinase [Kineosporiaceae bacterium]